MSKTALIPSLARLYADARRARIASTATDAWLVACGTRPDFVPWAGLRADDKARLLHNVAADADARYAYTARAAHAVDASERSVEHVVPRLHVAGAAPGRAEDDPIGWIQATHCENARRGNAPLYLWMDDDGSMALPRTLVRVDGENHYVPPVAQRARLARKWLFIRATYTGDGNLAPPSVAQARRAAQIVALAMHDPIQPAERRVNDDYRATLGWANPLLEDGARRFYDDPAWRARAFGIEGVPRAMA